MAFSPHCMWLHEAVGRGGNVHSLDKGLSYAKIGSNNPTVTKPREQSGKKRKSLIPPTCVVSHWSKLIQNYSKSNNATPNHGQSRSSFIHVWSWQVLSITLIENELLTWQNHQNVKWLSKVSSSVSIPTICSVSGGNRGEMVKIGNVAVAKCLFVVSLIGQGVRAGIEDVLVSLIMLWGTSSK